MITGVGLRTALGDTAVDLFDALLEKRTAVRARPQWATFEDFHTLVAAPVDSFEPQQIPRKYRRSMGRVAQFAVVASLDAVRAAGLEGATSENHRIGVVVGSTLGSSAADEEQVQIGIFHQPHRSPCRQVCKGKPDVRRREHEKPVAAA